MKIQNRNILRAGFPYKLYGGGLVVMVLVSYGFANYFSDMEHRAEKMRPNEPSKK